MLKGRANLHHPAPPRAQIAHDPLVFGWLILPTNLEAQECIYVQWLRFQCFCELRSLSKWLLQGSDIPYWVVRKLGWITPRMPTTAATESRLNVSLAVYM
jgi:hypothetical protein